MSVIGEFVSSRLDNDPIEECDELVLDGLKIKQFSVEDAKYLENTFNHINHLSLNQCQLQNLVNFPKLPNLKSLELQDNKLAGLKTIEIIVQQCPNLEDLLLAGNRFETINDFKPIEQLKNLTELDIEMNPITGKRSEQDAIRKKLFQLCPEAKVINGYDAQGNAVSEAESSDEEGPDANNDDFITNEDVDSKFQRPPHPNHLTPSDAF